MATPRRKKKPTPCMVCKRMTATVVRGKALYCRTCADDDGAALDASRAAVAVREDREKRQIMARLHAATKGGGVMGHAAGWAEHS